MDKKQLVQELTNIGVEKGDILNVKISIKSIGKVEGGINIIIDSLLEAVGPEGTIVCDSFISPFYSVFKWFKRNCVSKRCTPSYAGALANVMINRPDAFRSSHPIQAFTAIGKEAKALTESFREDSAPYGFLRKIADLGGKNLRIGDLNKVVGVGTTHVAICELGFWQICVPRGIYYIDKQGEKRFFYRYWANGCPKGFNKLMHYYYDGGAVINEGKVGNASALLTSMSKTLEIEKRLFKQNPSAFLCGDESCLNCSFAWEFSTGTLTQCIKSNLKKGSYKRAFEALVLSVFGTKHQ